MNSDTSERGLERLICTALTGHPCDPPQLGEMHERPAAYGVGWIGGDPHDYDREYCLDLAQLSTFLHETQPDTAEVFDLDHDNPTRRKFLARVQGEISKRGSIDVLRRGIKHGPHHLDLFYGTPSPGNAKAQARHAAHRFSVIRQLLADAARYGAGRRYLIQHSAGSGKSNSIAWLAHQLIGLPHDGAPAFDSIIVVTDRRILDQQIRDTIKQFAQVSATVGHAERSGDLRRFIAAGKKIIISTVQKFPFTLDEIGSEQRGRRFAIIIDEAHSSQGGRTSAAVSMALGEASGEEDEDTAEDRINRLMEAKKLLPNASYFAFTATPKNKTLEIFGAPEPQPDGTRRHRPFHSYTMKQAIQEGFILDVLRHYTLVESYYKLVKKVEADPEFDTKRAKKKLRRYVESHEHAIRLKAEIMVDHFHEQVLALNKIGGQARAMVVTSGIERAIQYYHAIRDYLLERKSPYRAIVAFSGEHDKALARVMTAVLKDDTELFKQFMDNESFRRWMTDMVFGLTYETAEGAASPPDEGQDRLGPRS